VAGASVVVAGGRGVGSAAGFALIEKVADVLGGAVGGSHAAADLGWCPYDALIGQTGAIVHPRLYLACGISGSVHHRAGMRHAGTIVAIDKDPAAPIFRIADVGVVGDLHEILPELLAELARRRGAPDALPAALPEPAHAEPTYPEPTCPEPTCPEPACPEPT
jgi:electron transfer flavoprotein alpha subunit